MIINLILRIMKLRTIISYVKEVEKDTKVPSASCFATVFTLLHSRVLTRWHGCASIVVRYSRDRPGTLADAMLSLALVFGQCLGTGALPGKVRARTSFLNLDIYDFQRCEKMGCSVRE